MVRPRFIALYLPQFHSTKTNDQAYGPGFTEWSNLRKSQKLFRGHDWPTVPGELGYYDLRDPLVRQAQADLAREHGIEAFCYYHYWFGNGRMELELPFREVLQSGQPDFPFCLCWANQSWHKKFWNADGSHRRELLVEQTYPGDDDVVQHFNYCLPAFRDSRYVRVDGKPVFMIYRALEHPDARQFIQRWQQLARENGLPGIFFIAQTERLASEEKHLLDTGVDGINTVRLFDHFKFATSRPVRALKKLYWQLARLPRITPYAKAAPLFVSAQERREKIYPSVIPNWDHTPRSGLGGTVLTGSTPALFEQHVVEAVDAVSAKVPEHQLIFIKSWNEWGEGNYLEPDQRHGRAYLEVLRRVAETAKGR